MNMGMVARDGIIHPCKTATATRNTGVSSEDVLNLRTSFRRTFEL